MLESKGHKRTIASVLAVAAIIAPQVSFLAPFAEMISQIAAVFGFTGVGHAAASKLTK